MTYTIIATTDGKFIGDEIELDSTMKSIKLADDVILTFDNKIDLVDGIRLANSNYTIDLREVDDV